jgi:plastocyanin
MPIIAALLVGALALPTPQAGAQATGLVVVHIKDFKFVPATLKIKSGTTVRFVNDDQDAHTATALEKRFDSGGLDTGDAWSHVFSTPGTYSYFCAVHPFMKGVVIVSAS